MYLCLSLQAIWKKELVEIFHELSLQAMLSLIPQSNENEKTEDSGCGVARI